MISVPGNGGEIVFKLVKYELHIGSFVASRRCGYGLSLVYWWRTWTGRKDGNAAMYFVMFEVSDLPQEDNRRE